MIRLDEYNRLLNRQHFFGKSARGLGSLALASLLNRNLFSAPENPLLLSHGVVKSLHFAPKAKQVMYLFMSGAPCSSICSITNRSW